MFQFLYIFGPAAITFLIVGRLCGRTTDYFTAAVELVAYAAIDAAVTSLLLLPFGRVELVFNESGIRNIRYGGTAFFLSLILSVIIGIAAVAFFKRVDISLQITKKTKGTDDEKEKLD